MFEHRDGGTTTFTRAIVSSGDDEHRSYSSEYSVGNKKVSMKEFTAELLKLGVNTKARNFLVFQVHTCQQGTLWAAHVHGAPRKIGETNENSYIRMSDSDSSLSLSSR